MLAIAPRIEAKATVISPNFAMLTGNRLQFGQFGTQKLELKPQKNPSVHIEGQTALPTVPFGGDRLSTIIVTS